VVDFAKLDDAYQQRVLRAFEKASRAASRSDARPTAASLGSDVSFSAGHFLPIQSIADLDKESPLLFETGKNLIPITSGTQVKAFARAPCTDALGQEEAPLTVTFPNDRQLENFRLAQAMIQNSFVGDFELSLVEFRPAQVKAICLSGQNSKVFVVYSISARALGEKQLPLIAVDESFFDMLRASGVVEGIIEESTKEEGGE